MFLRLSALVAALTLAVAPALAQDDYVWPVPQISADPATLPEAARATRQALIEAARTGDIEALRPIIEAQEFPPTFSFGDTEDGIGYLKEISEDAAGRQLLGLLIDLLDQPFAYHPDSGGETYYIWPYLAELDPSALTPEQIVDAYRLLDTKQIAELQEMGAWYYWRVLISESGEWAAFVAGD